ncbi:hypothetical protein VTL71DRAFT_4118 [Oculimacula yallundae]|uniref:Restriction of telomere capping protein 4 n=1 Tax=Oculimacula yallundae TaxID=86028 RepID=A0ABR4C4X5_9HELO
MSDFRTTTKLHLDSAQQRRIGLTKESYKYAPLLRSLNASPNTPPAPMASKTHAKRPAAVQRSPMKEEIEEDVGRAPESSSDSENEPDPSEIKETNYTSASSRAVEPETPNELSSTKKGQALADRGTNEKSKSTRSGTRGAKAVPSPSNSSVSSRSGTKRKVEEQSTKLGGGNTDVFGSLVQSKKRVTKTYGNTKPKILVTKKKPKDKLKKYASAEDSPQKSETSKGLKILSDIESSPESTPKKASGLTRPADLGFTPTPTKVEKSLRKYDMDDLSDSDEASAKEATKKLRLPAMDESPVKQTEGITAYTLDLGADLMSTAKSIIDKDRDELGPVSQDMDYDFQSMTQRACCPMCGADVSPDEIRAHSKNGVMNIRTQEKFCRAHKMKTAQDDWEINSYPSIDWAKLDSRISKHHAFIKKLIDGESSHYRELWDNKVTAGGDRNLMKLTSTLTPGFYGARGLRMFSENIMRKFTPLLKKRAPQDPLISARGFAAYVQSVLVPEVAVQLIMEDMDVDVEEGRRVLSDSVEVGELLNEEIKDVVTRKVVDSDGDDESD